MNDNTSDNPDVIETASAVAETLDKGANALEKDIDTFVKKIVDGLTAVTRANAQTKQGYEMMLVRGYLEGFRHALLVGQKTASASRSPEECIGILNTVLRVREVSQDRFKLRFLQAAVASLKEAKGNDELEEIAERVSALRDSING